MEINEYLIKLFQIIKDMENVSLFRERAKLSKTEFALLREIVMEGTPADIFERHEELETYNLALPRIGYICQKLREGGMNVADTLDAEKLAEEIAQCVSERNI